MKRRIYLDILKGYEDFGIYYSIMHKEAVDKDLEESRVDYRVRKECQGFEDRLFKEETKKAIRKALEP